MDDEDRVKLASVHLKDEVLEFLRSEVGRYLHGRAKLDVEAAKAELLECNLHSWWGRRKAHRIQARGLVAQQVLQYCTDAIQDGLIAEKEISQQQ